MRVSITRRNLIRGVGLFGAAAAMLACSRQEAQTESSASDPAPLLAIIHTNDTHGHDVEVKSTKDVDGNFSMAAVTKLKADWEAKGYDVLLVDAGDATQGMPLVDQSRGESAITFMNACGYQVMALSNHEFDRGDEAIKKYQEMANFELISANVKVKDTDELRFTPNKVFELSDGTKVGFFGLLTPSTMTTTRPQNIEGFTFLGGKDLYACA